MKLGEYENYIELKIIRLIKKKIGCINNNQVLNIIIIFNTGFIKFILLIIIINNQLIFKYLMLKLIQNAPNTEEN